VRAFPVRLPSGVRYWTVLGEDLAVVAEADAFLRHVRFGREGSELTTRSYAGGIALFLRWCVRTGRHWHDGVAALGLFITWLRHAGPQSSGVEVVAGGQVLAGPGLEPVVTARARVGFGRRCYGCRRPSRRKCRRAGPGFPTIKQV
jgi:integrase/recombinase XerD